ncbi:hypothetical protein [Leucobacter sp. gxy201]|uniref:hypothetical protein n=1 Tax=Leucobacter sp. gxy201 TaxID=2957200 RepID=UPI003DA1796A
MTPMTIRIPALVSAGFTALYIVAKADFAFAGKLGIHGGPHVTAAETLQYANAAQISLAQWANAGVGALMLCAVLLPFLPVTQRWHPVAFAPPLAVLGAALAALGVFTVAGSILEDRGGWPFGTFCLLWGLSVLLLAVAIWRSRSPHCGAERSREEQGA